MNAISEDVSCAACGYNLRGLISSATCPECNFRIEASLLELAERRHTMGPPLWTCDRRWLTDLSEGAALVVIIFVLMLVMAALPDAMWAWRKPSRAVLLGIGCTIWVLAWFAAWKLGRPEPGTVTRRAWWLRITATTYLTVPFLWGLAPREMIMPILWVVAFVAGLFAGVAACVIYYCALLRDLAGRTGSRALPVHATLLAFIGVLFLPAVLIFPQEHGTSDSLSTIIGLPTIQIGATQHVRHVLRMWRGGWHPLEWLMLVFPLWSIAVNGWLLALLIQTRRRAEAGMPAITPASAEASDGKTAASFRP